MATWRTDQRRRRWRSWELVALTPEAERGLWSFLASQVEQRSAVTMRTPVDQPFWALLREPAMFEAVNRGFIINDVAALTMSFMARVVDVRTALEARQIWCGALTATQAQHYDLLEAPAPTVELWDRAFPWGPPFIARPDWF